MIDKQIRPESAVHKEPHLIDITNLYDVAIWVIQAASAGVIGAAAYDLLNGIKRRFGTDKIEELKKAVYEEIKKRKNDPGSTHEQIKKRIDTFFREFD